MVSSKIKPARWAWTIYTAYKKHFQPNSADLFQILVDHIKIGKNWTENQRFMFRLLN